jgi:hypothetical protein
MSVIDERTGAFQSLVVSDQGPYRLVHSGDVKIYENLDVLPRAFVVHSAEEASDEVALSLMQDVGFDPATHVILAEDGSGVLALEASEESTDTIRFLRDEPELVELVVDSAAPGYLVLTDSWYPGWHAMVDGEDVAIERADILFRAIPISSGTTHIVFIFRPTSFRLGIAISLAATVSLLLAAVISLGAPSLFKRIATRWQKRTVGRH